MRSKPLWAVWLWGGVLLVSILACGGFFMGRATPDLPWLGEETPQADNPARWGIPPTVTPTPLNAGQGWMAAPTHPATAQPAPVTATAPPRPQGTATLPPSPAPTLPPTFTPRLSLRPGPQLVAYQVRQPIRVDGDPADWPQDLPWYPISQVTYGLDQYTGPRDLSGRVRVAWDSDYLYIVWDVTDDVFVQTQRGEFIYQGDSTEILVDTNLAYDFYSQYLDYDDYQIGFSPGNPPGQNPETWLWYPKSLAGPVLGVRVAAQPTVTGYTLEVALPWHRLNLTPFPGLDVGFAASISDNDLPGSALQQSLASTSPFRRLTDPTTWGELLLVARAY